MSVGIYLFYIDKFKSLFAPLKLRQQKYIRDEFREKEQILVVSSVMPIEIKAGNEYRVQNLTKCISDKGYQTSILIFNQQQIASQTVCTKLNSNFKNWWILTTDGKIQSNEYFMPRSLKYSIFNVVCLRALYTLKYGFNAGYLVYSFSSPFLKFLVSEILRKYSFACVISSYVFTAPLLELFRADKTLCVIDTHDVFSRKSVLHVEYYGDRTGISTKNEKSLLEKADLAIGIQSDETKILKALAPNLSVITCGIQLDQIAQYKNSNFSKIGYVASGNSYNTIALQRYLSVVHPLLMEKFPDYELVVAGSICGKFPSMWPGVQFVGEYVYPKEVYEKFDLTINPSAHGTGLKIKGIESIEHGRLYVSLPNGCEGIPIVLENYAYFKVADLYQMFLKIESIIIASRYNKLIDPTEYIRRVIGKQNAYAELLNVLEPLVSKRQ
jgi:hypothetical protein